MDRRYPSDSLVVDYFKSNWFDNTHLIPKCSSLQ